ncbi:MAG: hypothetical protein LH609_23380 [Rudanella sp.]|nr:hypothetical protein [Rudanella sp.]
MVTIRMYNVGLGDCFLLRFKAPAPNRDRFMLIDCGLILGSVAGEATLRAVAEDIFDTTGGRLDVVVATHEHQDHLSGFWYAQDIFKKIKIDKVCMAWTERPGDEMARRLKDKIEDFSFRLDGVVSKLEDDTLKNPQKFNLRAQSSLKSVRSVLDFLGLDTDDSIPKNGSGNPHNEDEQTPKKKVSMNRKALDYLQKEAVRPENIVYHEPDTTTTLDHTH